MINSKPETTMNGQMSLSTNIKSLPYRLLAQPRMRAARHLMLAAAILLICFSQTFSRYTTLAGEMGGAIYWLVLVSTAAYLMVAYLHIYRLAPRYLTTGRYTLYVLFSVLAVACMLLVRAGEDYIVYDLWGFPGTTRSRIVVAMGNISDFAVDMICITGVSVTVLLKYWLREESAVTALETARLANEVEALKETVDPEMLLAAIHTCGERAASAPENSAGIILRLSGVLRYQLYESRKKMVLLQSEIGFIKEYLELDRALRSDSGHTLEVTGQVMGIFVPPLAFMPFIRHAISMAGDNGSLLFRIDVTAEELRFSYPGHKVSEQTGIQGNIWDSNEAALVTGTERLRDIYGERFLYRFGTEDENGFDTEGEAKSAGHGQGIFTIIITHE